MSSNKLETKLEFDRQLLQDVGIFDKDNNGFMSVKFGDNVEAVTIGGRRLVLTTRELLREGDWEARIAFHPLSEQITQGPSVVLNALKSYIVERTKETLKTIVDSLATLASEPARQKNLSAKASKYLSAFNSETFDATTAKTVRAVLKATMNDAPEKRFLSMFLQNGGTDGALRTCQVSFPFLEEIDHSDPTTLFGVKMPRKTKDKALILALFDYVLGTEDERATKYSRGVKDGDAPYLHSLLLSFEALAKRINDLIEIHGTACQDLKPLKLELAWTTTLGNFDQFVRTYGVSVPALPGNVGVEDEDEEDKPKSSVYDSDDSDLGGGKKSDKIDPPWEEREDRELSRRDRDRNERDERDERSRGGKSMGDIFRSSNRGNDRDRNDRSRDRDDRDRDRNSRFGRDRDRDRNRRNW